MVLVAMFELGEVCLFWEKGKGRLSTLTGLGGTGCCRLTCLLDTA